MSKQTTPSPEYRTKTVRVGSCTVVIHRPILDEKERAKRESSIQTALSNFGKSLANARALNT